MQGKTLQELLSEAGISQIELTQILNLSESQVSLLVNGKRRMSIDYAAVIATQLNTTIDAVFSALNYAKLKSNNAVASKQKVARL